MGSLTKRPKIPKQVPPVKTIYVNNPTSPEVTAVSTEASEAQVTSEERKESLLRRTRGRLGTIFTGFKGFLSEGEQSTRKTLLGE
ncbi:MAG: hypothetical protein CMH31_03140 [Micavibrio sp.]|nr:hypothetical protein [Micavibrio sp.]